MKVGQKCTRCGEEFPLGASHDCSGLFKAAEILEKKAETLEVLASVNLSWTLKTIAKALRGEE